MGVQLSSLSLFHSIRKIIGKVLVFIIALFLLSPTGKTFATNAGSAPVAQTQTKTQEERQTEQMISRNGVMEVLSQGAYLLIWPLVALAGLAMDNGLVYGSFLNLDAPLWKVWTIVKNISNFLLGFVFLAGILIYSLSPERKELFKGVSNPIALIKKTLVAGVLIQMSWFVMMVAVDISTVLTYTVGGLPTVLLAQSDAQMDTKVLGMGVVADFGSAGTNGVKEQNDSLNWYVTLPSVKEGESPKYVAQCKVFPVLKKQEGGTGNIALFGRIYPSLGTGSSAVKMERGYCFFNGTIFSYKEWITDDSKFNEERIMLTQKLKDPQQSQQTYEDMRTKNQAFLATDKTQETGGADDCKYFGPVSNAPKIEKADSGSGANASQKVYECLYATHGLTLSTLIDKATSRTGPFMALYANMINFAKIDDSLGIKQQFMILLLNVFFLGAILLPLIAIVGVLFWRVVQLWLAIALSPLIALKQVFGSLIGDTIGKSLDFLDISEVIKLLFAPVLIGFALSISLMFVSILKTTLRPHNSDSDPFSVSSQKAITSLTGMECNSQNECSLLGFIKLKLSSEIIDLYWFLISMVGVALTWFLLFAAISYTKFGKTLGTQIKDLGEKVMLTQPLIPLPGKNTTVGLGALSKMPTTVMDSYTRKFDERHREDLNLFSTNEDTARTTLHKRWAESYLRGDEGVYGKRFEEYNPATHTEKLAMLTTLKTQADNGNIYNSQQRIANTVKMVDFAKTYATAIKNAKGSTADLQAVEALYKTQDENPSPTTNQIS